MFLTDTTAIYPEMKTVRTEVVVKEGFNVNLTCHGRNVQSHDTTVLWKFNGHKIQGNINKDKKFLDGTGTFSLYLKNVSEKDVGNYTCLAKVSAGGSKTDDDEDYVVLSLDKNGELLLQQFPLTEAQLNR